MGIVFQHNKPLVGTSFPEEDVTFRNALIQPGQAEVTQKAATLSAEEVERILLKLDQLAMSVQHEGIANMVAEEIDSILLTIRMVKTETKQDFMGLLGFGSQLDMRWLVPKDVGATWFTSDTGSIGLHAGSAGAVYTWLHTYTANTDSDIIPEQTLKEEVGLVLLGAMDTVEVPKCNKIEFTLAGIPAPAQSLPFNIRKTFGNNSLPFVRFEKPIIVGPEKKIKVEVMPNISGDSKLQLLAFVIAKAEDLAL